jgi:hypothetical protein
VLGLTNVSVKSGHAQSADWRVPPTQSLTCVGYYLGLARSREVLICPEVRAGGEMGRRKPADVLRTRIADPTISRSLAGRARARRWSLFSSYFPQLESMTVLDLGGTPFTWMHLADHSAAVVLVNRDAQPQTSLAWLTTVIGDACALPQAIRGRPFDIVYSNSVIEHVGGYCQRRQFSESVHQAAARHWIQTPYRYFPVEPHWLFPFFQFLTPRGRASIARHWRLAHEYDPHRPRDENVERVLSVATIDLTHRQGRRVAVMISAMVASCAELPYG